MQWNQFFYFIKKYKTVSHLPDFSLKQVTALGLFTRSVTVPRRHQLQAAEQLLLQRRFPPFPAVRQLTVYIQPAATVRRGLPATTVSV